MTVRVRVNSRNQVTLPAALRKQINIKSGDSLLVERRGDHLLLIPEPDHYSRRLRGLHREIWAGVDPHEYVRQEREGWRDQVSPAAV